MQYGFGEVFDRIPFVFVSNATIVIKYICSYIHHTGTTYDDKRVAIEAHTFFYARQITRET